MLPVTLAPCTTAPLSVVSPPESICTWLPLTCVSTWVTDVPSARPLPVLAAASIVNPF